MSTNNISVDKIYKILLVGDTSVGKTSLILRYTENNFQSDGLPTLGVDVKYKYISLDNKKIRLDLWDTAGQERFRGIAKNYFRGGHGFIFVYDISNKATFDRLKTWMSDAKSFLTNDYRMIVVGNKADSTDRQVDKETLKEFGEKNNVEVFEVSAKTGEGVENAFTVLIENLSKVEGIGLNGNNEEDEDNVNKSYSLCESKHCNKGNKEKHPCNC